MKKKKRKYLRFIKKHLIELILLVTAILDFINELLRFLNN